MRAQSGFSLLEVVVVVAVATILVGASVPVLLRSLEAAEERATRAKLDSFGRGLADFYRDHGRLPKKKEGLAALITDPGTATWRGPYVAIDGSAGETLVDARGEAIGYKVSGSTATLEPGGFPGLAHETNVASIIQEWIARSQVEIGIVNDAAETYRKVTGAYPPDIGALVPGYVGQDFATDPWGQSYVVDAAGQFFFSSGADGVAGTGDDIRAPGQA